MLAKIKEAIRGKKTYLVGCTAILTTVVAWAVGEVTDVQAITAVFVALQTIFIRAGVKKAEVF